MKKAQYKLNDLVFAQCPGFPYWPAKIIKVYSDQVYKVDFYNHTTTSNLAYPSLIPFNPETIARERAQLKRDNSPHVEQVKKAIKQAEKELPLLNPPSPKDQRESRSRSRSPGNDKKTENVRDRKGEDRSRSRSPRNRLRKNNEQEKRRPAKLTRLATADISTFNDVITRDREKRIQRRQQKILKKNSLDPQETLPSRLRSGQKSEERSRQQSTSRPHRTTEHKVDETSKSAAQKNKVQKKPKKSKKVKKAKKKSAKKQEKQESGDEISAPKINVLPPPKIPEEHQSHTSQEVQESEREEDQNSHSGVPMEEEKKPHPLERQKDAIEEESLVRQESDKSKKMRPADLNERQEALPKKRQAQQEQVQAGAEKLDEKSINKEPVADASRPEPMEVEQRPAYRVSSVEVEHSSISEHQNIDQDHQQPHSIKSHPKPPPEMVRPLSLQAQSVKEQSMAEWNTHKEGVDKEEKYVELAADEQSHLQKSVKENKPVHEQSSENNDLQSSLSYKSSEEPQREPAHSEHHQGHSVAHSQKSAAEASVELVDKESSRSPPAQADGSERDVLGRDKESESIEPDLVVEVSRKSGSLGAKGEDSSPLLDVIEELEPIVHLPSLADDHVSIQPQVSIDNSNAPGEANEAPSLSEPLLKAHSPLVEPQNEDLPEVNQNIEHDADKSLENQAELPLEKASESHAQAMVESGQARHREKEQVEEKQQQIEDAEDSPLQPEPMDIECVGPRSEKLADEVSFQNSLSSNKIRCMLSQKLPIQNRQSMEQRQREEWIALEKQYMSYCVAQNNNEEIKFSMNISLTLERMGKQPWETKIQVLCGYLDHLALCIKDQAAPLTDQQHQVFMVVLTRCLAPIGDYRTRQMIQKMMEVVTLEERKNICPLKQYLPIVMRLSIYQEMMNKEKKLPRHQLQPLEQLFEIFDRRHRQ